METVAGWGWVWSPGGFSLLWEVGSRVTVACEAREERSEGMSGGRPPEAGSGGGEAGPAAHGSPEVGDLGWTVGSAGRFLCHAQLCM